MVRLQKFTGAITRFVNLLAWANTSSMKWVIRDSVSFMASAGIENLRCLEVNPAGHLIAKLQRQVGVEISDKSEFIKLVQEFNRAGCIDLILLN